MTSEESRTTIIPLPAGITKEEVDSLTDHFSMVDPVIEFKVSRKQIHIEYLFPLISFSEIWEALQKHLDRRQFSPLRRLRYSSLAFKEANERDHLTRQDGWEKYIQDIYITYFHQSSDEQSRLRMRYTDNKAALEQLRERT